MNITTNFNSRLLHALLHRIMAALAQRLKIALIPKQFFILTMSNYVVNNCCCDNLALLKVHCTKWMSRQNFGTQP